jgi:alkyl hydroperoxide reductase subunit AhpC
MGQAQREAIGLSVDPANSHAGWAKDIEETQGQTLNFPVIADADRKVSDLYGMVHPEADPSITVRTVFIVDPNKKVRLMLTYPPSTGRNFDEILRVIDSLQLTDAHKVATPVNWTDGKPVIISPSLSNEEATQRFPGGWKELKPYLRVVDQPPLPRA